MEIDGKTKTSVTALVGLDTKYDVFVDWSDADLDMDCTCPAFEKFGPCKHIWATLMQVDKEHGSLPANSDQAATDEDMDFGPGLVSILGPVASGPAGRMSRGGGSHFGWGSRPKRQSWGKLLGEVYGSMASESLAFHPQAPEVDGLLYVVDVPGTLQGESLIVEVLERSRKRDGEWSVPKPYSLSTANISVLPSPQDQQIATLLLGASPATSYYSYDAYRNSRYCLPKHLIDMLMPLFCRTGRCYLRQELKGALTPLALDDGSPWVFHLEVRKNEARDQYVLQGALHRGTQREELASPVLLVASGWVFWPDRAARLDDSQAFEWISLLRQEKEVRVPGRESGKLLERILRIPRVPPLDLPSELEFQRIQGVPRPCLKIRRHEYWGRNKLQAELSFEYSGMQIDEGKAEAGLFLPESRQWVARDLQAEYLATQRLAELGVSVGRYYTGPTRELAAKKLPALAKALLAENWRVEAEGKLYRRASSVSASVSSGIDWLELKGQVEFEGGSASLPAVLAALRKGQDMVVLDDGTMGLLPEEWLKQYELAARMGEAHKDSIRFKPSQIALLDAMLSDRPEVAFDADFTKAREELHRFTNVQPVDPPATFTGQLRPYQCDGLGWMLFLHRFGLGGCLADDMGLGKTVQVLALLEMHRHQRALSEPAAAKPSLIVVPRSLVFNWLQEAGRFTPSLRILDYSDVGRRKVDVAELAGYDLVLTTYGTLRRDIAVLKDVPFDYVILDESQAIKNEKTASAKAVRLLNGAHRLCLSGTPIENHLGELWSQFEFLNPGMLGGSSAFVGGRTVDDQTRQWLSRALRPFILRRTKEQVAKELPPRMEQTIQCQMGADQRRLYTELRDHYRQALLARVERDGLAKSKMHILEALLRLRQAACHPGLIDKELADKPSAKLDALMPQIADVIEEGHKALVFSQFTSLLSIVRKRMDGEGIVYEYLDGRTRDRQAKVERFQGDPNCRLFLISLKAGGLGLNLTAADYVFLLDPWWNPAVEAQAVDRAHRIGQTRQVFAYRFIAHDTVEEKVLQLQQSKRALADAIITPDNSLIRQLRREDLELLLT